MYEVYLQRQYGHGESYVVREVSEKELPFYHVEERQINCTVCKNSQTVLCSKTFSPMFCPVCTDKRIEEYIKARTPRVKVFGSKNIPSWRLDLDEATPEQILERSSGDFNVPYKSHGEWQEFYNQPHELEKQREAERQRNEEANETLRSLG